MGVIDLPEFIQYVLKITGKEKLTYFGHSQGTTNFMIGASMMPEFFTEKVQYGVMLSPVIRLDLIPSFFVYLMSAVDVVFKMLEQDLGFANTTAKMHSLEN
jgi:pimeloyl-ACP methyl ester carboxylesterase